MQYHAPHSHDPIADHLMSSRAFKGMFWVFFVVLVGVGLVVVGYGGAASSYRVFILDFAAGPLAGCVPLTAIFVLPCSRRLR
jgi:hypothetical protein